MSRTSFHVLCLLIFLTMLIGNVFVAQAQPTQELFYDDDGFENASWYPTAGGQEANKFSLPAGWTSAQILNASYYIWRDPAKFKVVIYGGDGTTVLGSLNVTPTTTGWFGVDLTGLSIVVSGDFYIVMEWLGELGPMLGFDTTSPDSMSYARPSSGQAWIQVTDRDYGIRVFVQTEILPPTPEFDLSVPIVTSVSAALYMLIRRRLSNRKE